MSLVRGKLANHNGRECCWPYVIGQHPLSPVFDQKRPGTPGNSYFAQLPAVFDHFMFHSGGLLRGSTIGEGGDTTISSPGRSSKQPLPGIGLHDPRCKFVTSPPSPIVEWVYSTTRTDQHGPQEQKQQNFAQVTWRLTTFSRVSVTISGLILLSAWGILRSFITPA